MNSYFRDFIKNLLGAATLVVMLTACGPTTTPRPEIVVQPPMPTPTLEPTFTPLPSPANTSTPLPTTTSEPTSTPLPEASLSGRILDQDTGQPIARAKVSVGTNAATTDANGRYSLIGLSPGPYILSATREGYDPALSAIFILVAGQEFEVDLSLFAPDTSPYPQDPMLTNPLDPNGAPTQEDAERLARLQGLTGEVVSIEETKLRGKFLVNYKIGDDIRAAIASLNHEAWELTDETGRIWWIIKVCGNLVSPLPKQIAIATPAPRPLSPMAEVIVDGLVVRTCAAEGCVEVGTVQHGERVEVFGCLADGGWCEVSWPGGRGWCTGQSLRQLAIAGAVPVVEAVLPTATPGVAASRTGKIVFASDRDGNFEIYVMSADGSGLRRLTDHLADDRFPAWSPDGQQIAFISDRDDGNYEIYLMNADGTNLTRFTNDPAFNGTPAWSPDGHRIAFTSNAEIYVMNVDGSGLRRLTDHPAGAEDPTWSPDGRQIAFSSDRDDPDFQTCGSTDNPCNHNIYVMNADGSGLTRLTNYPTTASEPAWSPDGSQIAFYYNGYIYVMNADGSNHTRLSDDSGFPAWSPDGRHIVFESAHNHYDNWEIYVINTDGSGLTRLTNHPARDWFPSWSR